MFLNEIKSIAIGSFDGIHVAHQALIEQADAAVIIERNGGYLTPGHKRSLYTSKICCFYHFDKVSALTPEEFIEMLKSDFPKLETIVVGYDFVFGKERSGNTGTLKTLFDGEVVIVDEVSIEGISVHSRTIKAYLKEGKIAMVNALLGREYEIVGKPIQGQGLGKKKLAATINLKIESYQLPQEGVYATRTKIGNTWYDSVSFVGHRVTTDGGFAVETHILDDEIGEVFTKVWIAFVAHIRENQKFDDLESLKIQIGKDIDQAKKVLR